MMWWNKKKPIFIDDRIDLKHKACRITTENGETISFKISGGKIDVTVRPSGLSTTCFYPKGGGAIVWGHTDERMKFINGETNGP